MPVVLVVEDDEDARRLIARWLGQDGYVVEATPDAETALERLTQSRYDLVVLDVVLPGLDGYELTRRLRARGADSPPVLLCSITERDDIPDEFVAQPWLAKPFARQQLLDAVRRALDAHADAHADADADADADAHD